MFKGITLKLSKAENKSPKVLRKRRARGVADGEFSQEDDARKISDGSVEKTNSSRSSSPVEHVLKFGVDGSKKVDKNENSLLTDDYMSEMKEKPMLKLFFKSSESIDNLQNASSIPPVQSQNIEPKDPPTMLRIRISSSDDKLGRILSRSDDSQMTPGNLSTGPGSRTSSPKKKSPAKEELRLSSSKESNESKLLRKKRNAVERESDDKGRELRPRRGKESKIQDPSSEKAMKNEDLMILKAKRKMVKKVKKSKATLSSPSLIDEVPEVMSGEEPLENLKSPMKTEEIINEDFCSACKGTGYFICCETCPKSFHLSCVYPPLSKVPSGTWQCAECLLDRPVKRLVNGEISEAKEKMERFIECYPDIWGHIWAKAVLSNPVTFNLPKKLRPKKELPMTLELVDESTIQVQPKRRSSVISLTEGKTKLSAASTAVLPIPSTTKKSSTINTRSAGASMTVQPTLNRRMSETGYCHHCGERSIIPELLPLRAQPLQPRPLIKCDACPLLWHMDCVDPPLTHVPSAEGRWLCPAHINLPIHPNWIPDVELETGNPFEYQIGMRLLGPPPPFKVLLPESSIILNFGARARKMRREAAGQVVAPPVVQTSYASFVELASRHPGGTI